MVDRTWNNGQGKYPYRVYPTVPQRTLAQEIRELKNALPFQHKYTKASN